MPNASKWFDGVKKDFFNRRFIPLKILHFFMVGGMTTLFPFLTIQARSLGISGEELGIIYSLMPVVGIFAPSVSGMLADKIGNFRIFLSISVTCSGLASLLFLTIPQGRIVHTLPDDLHLLLNCYPDGAHITVLPPFICETRANSSNAPIMTIRRCSFTCPKNKSHDLTKEFVSEWCTGKDQCEILDDAAVHFEAEVTSKDEYEVEGQRSVNSWLHMTLHNFSLPIDVRQRGSETEFGTKDAFCPHYKQLRGPAPLGAALGCPLRCEAFTQRRSLCTNEKSTETINPGLTVIVYVVVRILNGLMLSMSFTLFNGAVVSILKEYNGDLGLQTMYGNLGMIVMTPISGKLIDVFSSRNHKDDYSPAFFLYCAIKFICAVLFCFIDLEFKQASNHVVKDFKALVVQPRVTVFLLFTAVAGTCFGFVETFLFWLLEDLGADKSLMGITVTVGSLVGIPLMMTSSLFISKFGYVNTLSFCMSVYVVRLLGYSLIQNPWLAMPFEAMECFTNSLMTVTSTTYAGALSLPSTVASLQGLYSGTYHGVGRGIGSLSGGIMIKNLGNAGTFQVLAAVCGVSSILYFLVNKLVLKDSLISPKENAKQHPDEEQNPKEEKHSKEDQLPSADQRPKEEDSQSANNKFQETKDSVSNGKIIEIKSVLPSSDEKVHPKGVDVRGNEHEAFEGSSK